MSEGDEDGSAAVTGLRPSSARATCTVFTALGLAGATWGSRLPQIRARMGLNPASLGLLLLMIAVGGVVLPLAKTVGTCFGPRRTVTAVAVLVGVSLGAVALGYALWTPLVGAGLFLLGTATGFWASPCPCTPLPRNGAWAARSCPASSPRSVSVRLPAPASVRR